MEFEEILKKALEIAVNDINELWDRLNNGLYIKYNTEDYIAGAYKKLSENKK